MDYEQAYFDLLKSYNDLKTENEDLRAQLTISEVSSSPIASVDQPTYQTIMPLGKVHNNSTPSEKIELFMSLFRGRDDVYAKRWHSDKSQKNGYSPVCTNEWIPGVCDKRQYKCPTCPNRQLAPLKQKAIDTHLRGQHPTAADVVGLYPMTKDECTYLLAVDFDDGEWQADISAFRKVCELDGIPVAIERSRSGNGAHAWFFFEDKVPAIEARRLGSGLLTQAMNLRHCIKLSSYDRLFPNQDTMPSGGFGNLIALPLQGQARKNDNSIFVDEHFMPYADQWSFLSNLQKISHADLERHTSKLCAGSDVGVLAESADEDKPWEKKRLEQPLAPFDFPPSVHVVSANMLYIEKRGISQRALNRIKRLGAFRNPEFYRAQAMRLPIYNKPRIIDTSEENEPYLMIPRGCIRDLEELIEQAGASPVITDETQHGAPVNMTFNGGLREEQRLAFDALMQHDIGVLSATTAFGKTVIGASIICARGVNSLVLVHTRTLLDQWQKSLSQFIAFADELPEQPKRCGRSKVRSTIGCLGGGKNSLTGRVDIATMQSLLDGNSVKDFVKDYGLIIIDECHHVSAFSFEKVLRTANARFVYGLTATATRQDGHHPIIFMQCGPIRYRVDAKAQAEKRGFEHYVLPRFTRFTMSPTEPDKPPNITSLYAALCDDMKRNELILTDVVNALGKGRTPIILTQRVAHVKILAERLKPHCANVVTLTGAGTQKSKRAMIESLNNMPADQPLTIIATGKYVGEGFDYPRLDTLFLAMPVAWKGTLQQYAGRLHRDYPGKTDVLVYDYVDVHVKMLDAMYHKRVKGYLSMGYKALGEAKTQERVGIIFDHRNFFAALSDDISNAAREILIVSPYLRKARVNQMRPFLEPMIINKVSITIVTRPADEYKLADQPAIHSMIESLENQGIHVVTRQRIHQKFAIVDRRVIWYGSINLLSFGGSEESMMRFENEEIALELVNSLDDQAKQMKCDMLS